MNKASSLQRYLSRYATSKRWRLVGAPPEDLSQVVVIPAYAEKELLFSTLASLAQNSASSLKYSFVLCVINNKKKSPAEIKLNNLQTMNVLNELVEGKNSSSDDDNLKGNLQKILESGLRLGYIDAASSGNEIPDNEGGVGMARKIGMDMSLRLLEKKGQGRKLILSLDADTLVENNYLASVNKYFCSDVKTAVVAYKHTEPHLDKEKAAIYCYEIFLRYWVLALRFAGSPFAFHSIGSTIVCSADAYLTVRGMNRREAGEDFYFLNKLAKVGSIGYIKDTCVYPSARISLRVPFGTGKRMSRFMAGTHDEHVLYNPQIFEIIGQWLTLMKNSLFSEESEISNQAAAIDPLLLSFLNKNNFAQAWSRIRRNFRNEKNLINSFHEWFDGFKTLKLVNYLSRNGYPPVEMFAAVSCILKKMNAALPDLKLESVNQELSSLKQFLQCLHKLT